uniref:S-phase kinase associated protein 2 n=1 Tax=Bos indicus x Bos taurus TaxID=30522 RepID=A0A4W2EBR9_BOBOX
IHRKHLQEIPDQSSNVTASFTWGWGSSKTSEMLSGMGVSALEKEEVDSENIPQELLSNLSHPQSSPRKWLKSKVNYKDVVIVCRPKSDVSTLAGRCPNLVHLDLSDSVMLKNDCFPEFYQLNYLQHLSFSWCYEWHPTPYDIIPETLLELAEIPTLKTLQVFGIMPDSTFQLLKEALPHLQINCSHFTTITRPTIGNKKNQEIWGIKCSKFESCLPSCHSS